MPGTSEVSERTQQLIDQEVRRIVDEAHQQVVALLRENRDKLDSLAQALLEHETLDENEAYQQDAEPDRNVDEEDQLPGHKLRQHAAEEQADRGPAAGDRSEDPERPVQRPS